MNIGEWANTDWSTGCSFALSCTTSEEVDAAGGIFRRERRRGLDPVSHKDWRKKHHSDSESLSGHEEKITEELGETPIPLELLYRNI